MSSQNNHPHQDSNYAMFTQIIFIVSFILVAGLIFLVTPSQPDAAQDVVDEATAVAVLIETSTATDTPPPRTATQPLPTATLSPPTMTDIPVTDDSPPDNDDHAALITNGAGLYVTCAACHGADANGVAGLGKSLIDSAFMDSLSDEELVEFIKVGRDVFAPDNSTGIAMPPYGGNPSLSDADLVAIVAYIRSLSDTGALPSETDNADVDDTVINTTDDTTDAVLITTGAGLYVTCAACHGADANGVAGLGKSLIDSAFMDSLSDEELVEFIKVGRDVFAPDNSTGIAMPPYGGNPSLSDDDLVAIVAYIRSLSDTGAVPPEIDNTATSVPPTATVSPPTATSLPPTATLPPPTDEPTAEPTDAPAADSASSNTDDSTESNAAQIAAGAGLYVTCSACHGADASGIPGLGKSLIDSAFMDSLSDEELVEFIKVGRDVFAPDNSTGIAMPPYGGNPTLSDDDLLAIIIYIRSLDD